jgi:hypothetical protein
MWVVEIYRFVFAFAVVFLVCHSERSERTCCFPFFGYATQKVAVKPEENAAGT